MAGAITPESTQRVQSISPAAEACICCFSYVRSSELPLLAWTHDANSFRGLRLLCKARFLPWCSSCEAAGAVFGARPGMHIAGQPRGSPECRSCRRPQMPCRRSNVMDVQARREAWAIACHVWSGRSTVAAGADTCSLATAGLPPSRLQLCQQSSATLFTTPMGLAPSSAQCSAYRQRLFLPAALQHGSHDCLSARFCHCLATYTSCRAPRGC